MTNRLMQRKQMVLDVIHPNRPNASRAELQEKLGELYKTPKEQCFVFGLRTHYGGGRSTGFALIYDSQEALKLEATFRLVRVRILERKLLTAERTQAQGREAFSQAPERTQEVCIERTNWTNTAAVPRRCVAPKRPRPAMPRRSKLVLYGPLRLLCDAGYGSHWLCIFSLPLTFLLE